MKKYLVFILTVSILLLSACSTDANNKSSVETGTSKIEVSSNADDKQEDIDESGKVDTKVESDTTEQESKVNTSEEDKALQNTTSEPVSSNEEVSEQQNTADTTNKTDTKTEELKQEVQPKKTVITANAQTAKMSFRGSETINISKFKKEYVVDKNSQFERYKKDDIKSKSFNILGAEYTDMLYYESEKNKYTGDNYDKFEDEHSKIYVNQDGTIKHFLNHDGIQVLPDVNENTEEVAKNTLI